MTTTATAPVLSYISIQNESVYQTLVIYESPYHTMKMALVFLSWDEYNFLSKAHNYIVGQAEEFNVESEMAVECIWYAFEDDVDNTMKQNLKSPYRHYVGSFVEYQISSNYLQLTFPDLYIIRTGDSAKSLRTIFSN